jgi:hypothetical protein
MNHELSGGKVAVLDAASGLGNALAGRLLSGLRDKPGDRSAHRRPSPAGLGRHAGARAAVFMVSRIGADAEAAWTVRPSTSQSPGRRSMKTFGGGTHRQEFCGAGALPRVHLDFVVLGQAFSNFV